MVRSRGAWVLHLAQTSLPFISASRWLAGTGGGGHHELDTVLPSVNLQSGEEAESQQVPGEVGREVAEPGSRE